MCECFPEAILKDCEIRRTFLVSVSVLFQCIEMAEMRSSDNEQNVDFTHRSNVN